MIPIRNIVNRYKALNETSYDSANVNALMNGLQKRYNFDSINTLGRSLINNENVDWSIDYLFDRLEEVCDNDSESNAKQLTSTLCESINKVRQASQIGASLKRRFSFAKGKIISKINKNLSTVKQALGMQPHTKNNTPSPDSKYSKDFRQTQRMDQKRFTQARKGKPSSLVKTECFQKIADHVDMLRECDRVINTHEIIGKRYDTKKIFNEVYNDPELCVKEFCLLLDTYDIPFKTKIDICLENIAYEYERNNKSIDKSQLAEAVAEYFLINAAAFNEEVIQEAGNDKATKEKMAKLGHKLNKQCDKAEKENSSILQPIIGMCRKIASTLIDGTLFVGRTILSVIKLCVGCLVFLLFVNTALFAVTMIILTIVYIAIACIPLAIALGLWFIINPEDKKKLEEGAKKYKKNKKVHSGINRLLSSLSNAQTKSSIKSVKEDLHAVEYDLCLLEMEDALNNNNFYKPSEVKKALTYLEDVDLGTFDITFEDAILGISEANIKAASNIKSKASKAVSDLRTLAVKSPTSIKEKIKQAYCDSPDNIINESPNIFRILFDIVVIAGAFATTGVVGGIIVGMVTWFLALHITRQQCAKYTAQYKKERERAVKKGKKLKGDAKKRNEEYIKELDRAIEKLEMYERDQFTDEENDKKAGYNTDDDTGVTDNIDFDEAAVDIILIDKAVSVLESFNRKSFYQGLQERKVTSDVLKYIISEAVSSGLISKIEMDRNLSSIMSLTDDRDKIGVLREGMLYLDNLEVKPSNDLFRRAASSIAVQDVLHEVSFTATLTMLKDKIRQGAQNLSDKEKVASRTLDTSVENFKVGLENSLKQENREAVIKGQILPSASRIIKLAIVAGFAFLLHPALAIIYLLGMFAMSKKLRIKERQLVLDELDTELKVCQEYINKAKANQDMNAYRQCLQIEKKLLRQRDRLKYKLSAEWNERTPERYSNQDYQHKA